MAKLNDLVRSTRTVRRFQEARAIESATLMEVLDLARLGGSARNGQVLKYMLITTQEDREALFPLLAWAGYLTDWFGPEPGERPAAYVVCLLDRALLKGVEHEAHFDLGIASQNLLLGAAEQGIFGCRIGAFSPKVHGLLGLGEQYQVLLVIALGYPAETVRIEAMPANGSIRYWRDEQQVHHVPKRSLEELLIQPTRIGA
jgi:nitroreductase